jgi:hypothetical protein
MAILRTVLRLAVLFAIAAGAHFLMKWVLLRAADLPPDASSAVLGGFIVFMVIAYAALMAMPFVTGIEIGMMLMLMRGAEIAPVIYLATVFGLMTAFLAGKFINYSWLHRVLLDMRLRRAADLLDRINALPEDQRISVLRDRLPKRIGKWAIDFRYLAIVVLINLPGNGLVGGGGGICLTAGLSRIYSTGWMFLTLALAVLPFPVFVWFSDITIFAN